ncbi:MAG: general secretion pathway protein GspK [Proteobacteria bacterium]|nr:general secretion pathway protein GspK [Pseudomonadota bacterium]
MAEISILGRAPSPAARAGGEGAVEQRGFALVAVLWAGMMLAIIVASLMASARSEALIARNRLRTATLDATADAAINAAILRMLDPVPAQQPPADGSAFPVPFNGRTAEVRVTDEAGKVDLNKGDGALLTLLLRAAGLEPDAAKAMSDRIQDWRERSSLHRLAGAGEADYSDAGAPYGPRRGPFQTLDELRLVLGMTPQLFDRLAPSLTLATGTQWVEPDYAGHDVLMVLANMDETAVDEKLAARAAAPPPRVQPGHAYTIEAQVDEPGGRMTKRAVIRLTGNRAAPIAVYSWERVIAP